MAENSNIKITDLTGEKTNSNNSDHHKTCNICGGRYTQSLIKQHLATKKHQKAAGEGGASPQEASISKNQKDNASMERDNKQQKKEAKIVKKIIESYQELGYDIADLLKIKKIKLDKNQSDDESDKESDDESDSESEESEVPLKKSKSKKNTKSKPKPKVKGRKKKVESESDYETDSESSDDSEIDTQQIKKFTEKDFTNKSNK